MGIRTAPVDLSAAPVEASDAGVYVHFPYCAQKCPYCDFNSHVRPHDDARYADAILAELEGRGDALVVPARGLSSIYFGGGTPSLWAPEAVARVIAAIRARWTVADDVEITLEANPGTVDEARFGGFRAAGVNRFSLGCQSFDDAELKALGRIHDAQASFRAVRAAQSTGARVSLDLIYGLPGQTEADALASVRTALELAPDHLSAYTLTIEPETVLARRTALGLFKPMPDDDQAALIERVSDALADAGYARYEISSYARAGRVSVHNTLYWLGGAYLGVGAGACSYLPTTDLREAERRENLRAPERYLDDALARRHEAGFEETLDPLGILKDRLMVGFRTAFGLDAGALEREFASFGFRTSALEEALRGLERQGRLEARQGRWRPTFRGLLFNDAIARDMLEVAEACLPMAPR